MHASIMGYRAVDELLKGNYNRIMIMKDGKYSDIDVVEGLNCKRVYNDDLYKLVETFA